MMKPDREKDDWNAFLLSPLPHDASVPGNKDTSQYLLWFLLGLLLFLPWNFVFLCVSNHVSTAPEFVFLTCPHLCLCARSPFCQQGSWNIFQWMFLIYFYLLICCAYLCVHLPFSNKEAGTCLDEWNFNTSNSFTSKHLKGQLGIGTSLWITKKCM